MHPKRRITAPLRAPAFCLLVFLSLAISPDGESIAAGFKTGLVVLWNAKARTPSTLRTEPLSPVNDLAFSPDGKFFATGSHFVGSGGMRAA